MKKDIKIPKVEGIGIAITKEYEQEEEVHYAYLVNFNNVTLKNVLICSKGYGTKDEKQIKTSTFRHYFEEIPPLSYQMIELISEEVLGINNEFFITYYIDKLIYDKKYVFLPEAVLETNFIEIKILEKEGVLIK